MSVYIYRDALPNYMAECRLVRFTDEDDYHLCRYLSVVVPDKSAGGRTGNKIYQELENLVRTPTPWKQHSSLLRRFPL